MIFAESDVRGWRFGVWELQYRYGEKYWARCDCGREQAVVLDKLLSIDALSCDHLRHRGYFPMGPDAMICRNCGEHRRFTEMVSEFGGAVLGVRLEMYTPS